ncbi:LOW QUALITY PROTEIN: symplekin-like [Amphiura filiformis]|uniref:LOW QUALITY PROTEIN: symplekin-like n=1 Tax=Amphiura filiformis TaxID=82378 RepID=UPI003B21C7E4
MSEESSSSRRSVAGQFFTEDEGTESSANTTSEKVVELINQTQLLTKDNQKLANLKQVQELIVNKEPALLDNFLDEVLQFQHDKSADVRRFVIGFMEERGNKKDNEILCTVAPNLNMMLSDPEQHIIVTKKVILCNAQLLKVTVKWLITAKRVGDEMVDVWDIMWEMRDKIVTMLDSENDGIRTHAIKYVESAVIMFSVRTPDSEVPKKAEGDASLDQIPDEHKCLQASKLRGEGINCLDQLLKLLASPSITSVNLTACMGALTTISKQRPAFMSRVITAFETLHVNLPPTLAKSQVSSVRKSLKLQLFSLLRLPSSADIRPNIKLLLNDLGATDNEIAKNLPRVSSSSKRPRQDDDNDKGRSSKKTKTSKAIGKILDEEDEPTTSSRGRSTPTQVASKPTTTVVKPVTKLTMVDILSEEIQPLLGIVENVANLVLISMVTLPETMPPQFQATYTPIAAAGTGNQINHLARMMSSQFVAAGVKPKDSEKLALIEEANQEKKEEPKPSKPEIRGISVVGAGEESSGKKKPTQTQVSKGVKRIKQFRLNEITKPLEPEVASDLVTTAIKRIIEAGKASKHGGAAKDRVKILTALATQFGGDLTEVLREYMLEDLRSNSDIAFAWLYQEYANLRGYIPQFSEEDVGIERYDHLLCAMLDSLLTRSDQRDGLFTRLVMEAPIITDNAIKVIRKFCEDEVHFFSGMHALRELILKRPADIQNYLMELLDLTYHERTEVRSQSIQYVKRLYDRQDLRDTIETYATGCLKTLLKPSPTPQLIERLSSAEDQRLAHKTWIEECIKMCLYLYLALLPVNHKLIHELANVYVDTGSPIKRIVLRVLEAPVRGIGMSSPELLKFVENCPKGAETLVTRMLHILTDKAPPSPDLVKRVRDLYNRRVSDVRFLIPVLIGLEKTEVIEALPKLIKLNPGVVKEVFHRLLMSHQGDNSAGQSPLTPAELLIALHNIDSAKCDMKSIIKATSLCFNEKNIYTQEVLAVVLQQLMEQTPLPILLMRTVIQSLTMYPKLSGFIMNILRRLIEKSVWTQPKVWEGFIKCCERTQPQSYQVLLQLPPPQLRSVFSMSPGLRKPLLEHVRSFTEHQQAHIPAPILKILEAEDSGDRTLHEKQAIRHRLEPVQRRGSEDSSQNLQKTKLLQDKLNQEKRLQEPQWKEKLEKEKRMREEEMRRKEKRDAESEERKRRKESDSRDREDSKRRRSNNGRGSDSPSMRIKQEPIDPDDQPSHSPSVRIKQEPIDPDDQRSEKSDEGRPSKRRSSRLSKS